MEYKEIIENPFVIYDKLNLPFALKNHMLTTASCCSLICDNWIGPKINKDAVIAISLLHDLGNIAKISFSNDFVQKMLINSPNWFDLNASDEVIDFWKKRKQEFVNSYGSNDKFASLKILEEIDFPKEGIELFKEEEFFKFDTKKFEAKIGLYVDNRVSPHGIVTIRNRVEEAKSRYSITSEMISNYEKLLSDLEENIFNYIKFSPDFLSNQNIEPYLNKWDLSKLISPNQP